MTEVINIRFILGAARLSLSDGSMLCVPAAVFREKRVRPGQAIEPEEYLRSVRLIEYPFALESAMNYLAVSERSEKQIRDKLTRAGYGGETADRVIAALTGTGLLSDARFAEVYARRRASRYGKVRIRQELRLKGISDEEALEALDEIAPEDEYGQALRQARKLYRRSTDDPRADRERVIRSLMRKGYTYSVARQAAEESEKNEEDRNGEA